VGGKLDRMSPAPSPCAPARRVIDRIQAEHRLLARIIAAMQGWVVRQREPGAGADHVLFESMLRYVAEVPDRVHHPQEDAVIFPPMAAIAGAVVDELNAEHAAGERMLGAVRAAHAALLAGEPNALNRLSDAVDGFAEFYWAHMRKEEEVLLPLAAAGLTEEQWSRIEAAFSVVNDPLFAATPLSKEYSRLHRFIIERMPEPLKGYVQGAVRA
jgi:hemerythrin-like domain-containing protein